MTETVHHWVIIPAAGIGRRFGGDIPKQYLPLHTECVLAHTLSVWLDCPLIERVVVALHPDDLIWPSLPISGESGLLTVTGGHMRVISVFNAMMALRDLAQPDDWVWVHDAVRPGITQSLIEHCWTTIADDPVGGIVAMPVVDTLKQVDTQNRIEHTVSRDGLWAAQTPQIFRYARLMDALMSVLANPKLVTDESSALERLGDHPKVILGSWRNIKITTAADLEWLRELIPAKIT